jgi:L-lactate dehydrogenase complex protein LldF
MERLVPTLDDLALMLSLLPRSATGQKISVYTQLIHSPRRNGEQDGAAERHLIIIDNGRSRLRASPLKEALYCIRCGACLNACPVFREIGGHAYVGLDGTPAPYPGPIGSVVSPGLLGLQKFGHLAQASSLCGACKDACPVDIDLPKLLIRVRAGMHESAPMNQGIGLSLTSRIGLQVYGVIGSSSVLFAGAQKLGALASHLISPSSRWLRLPAFTGWGVSKDFPRPARRPFRQRWAGTSRTIAPHTAEIEPGGPETSSPRPYEPAAKEAAVERARPSAALVDRLVTEITDVGVETYRVRSSELPTRLITFLRGRGLDSLLAWDEIEGLDLASLADAGFRLVRSPDPAIRAGITGCAAAIAETGTLVVPGGSGQPLTASLLPDVHVAVIQTRQIVWSLEEALRLEAVIQSAATALITGPSRTADIEMTLTIGVHGPKELIAYIVE